MRARLMPLAIVVAIATSLLALAACGSNTPAPLKGATVSGPGITATKPPWPAKKDGLAQRIRLLGLPAPGKEKFHQHVLLHIYDNGILIPVTAGIGLDLKKNVAAGLHTHDFTGVLHLEADTPFTATLGDLFALWGVTFGPNQIGALKAGGDNKLRTFVNGKEISDPAKHLLHKDENIVIAYGSTNNFPKLPDTAALQAANGKGPRPAACSLAKKGQPKPKSCLVGNGIVNQDQQSSVIKP